jgi:hypothetical protein
MSAFGDSRLLHSRLTLLAACIFLKELTFLWFATTDRQTRTLGAHDVHIAPGPCLRALVQTEKRLTADVA